MSRSTSEQLGERVLILRRRLRMRQSDLAHKLQVSPSRLCLIEQCKMRDDALCHQAIRLLRKIEVSRNSSSKNMGQLSLLLEFQQ